MRFVITGSGRCGTKYMSKLLSAAGVLCGHEQVYNTIKPPVWPNDLQADSSWMAVPHLPLPYPVVLMVRHPLLVVKSWVEIGFFSEHDADNPTHNPLREWAPQVYDEDTPANRALSMWFHLNRAALPHAEKVIRLKEMTVDTLRDVLTWSESSTSHAEYAFSHVACMNQHTNMRQRVRVTHTPTWSVHRVKLMRDAQELAISLGININGDLHV